MLDRHNYFRVGRNYILLIKVVCYYKRKMFDICDRIQKTAPKSTKNNCSKGHALNMPYQIQNWLHIIFYYCNIYKYKNAISIDMLKL